MKNILYIFAASLTETKILTLTSVVFFLATNFAAKAENLGNFFNSYCAFKVGNCLCQDEESCLSSFNTLSISFMTETTKTASKANNSNVTSTQAGRYTALDRHKSAELTPLLFDSKSLGFENQTSNKQDFENVTNSLAISRDANDSEIHITDTNTQTIGDVSNSTALGCNLNGSNNTIIACPKEITDLIVELIKKGALL